MSFEKLDFFDESYNYGSGSAIGVGFGEFVPTRIESMGDVFLLVVFVLIGSEFKVGQLIGSFWRPKS